MLPHGLTARVITPAAMGAGHASTAGTPDGVMMFGFMAVVVALYFFCSRNEFRSSLLGLGICLAATAVYGFAEGAWPLGILLTAWSGTTVHDWFAQRRAGSDKCAGASRGKRRSSPLASIGVEFATESRITRMFGHG